MHDHSDKSIHSARALADHTQKKIEDDNKIESANEKNTQLASEQISLLMEFNELAKRTHIEAQQVRADSEKASKKSFIIAVVSLMVAIVSLVVSTVLAIT